MSFTDILSGTLGGAVGAPELKVDHFPSHYPQEFMTSPDTLWLKVTPKTFRPNINVQAGANQGTKSQTSLYFLVAKEFTFGVDHTWEDLTSIAGALRGVIAGVKDAISQGAAVFQSGQYLAGNTTKNDNPYIYKSSSKRKLTMEFNFATFRDPEGEVWNPIQSLIIWSCADKDAKAALSTTVNMPYVFKVQTVTGDGREVGLVNIENASLEAVMPSYKEPYKNGYPMSATCSLTFVDINPTYRSLISANGKSRISTGLDKPAQPRDVAKAKVIPTGNVGDAADIRGDNVQG